MKSLSVIIVNYKSREFLNSCIQSVFDSHSFNYTLGQVIIVNNDKSQLSLSTSEKIKIIEANENLGFGRACNLGVKSIDGDSDYLLFLNPDTEVSKEAISLCVKELEGNETIGVCGAANCDEKYKPYRTCENVNSFKDIFVKSIGLGSYRVIYSNDFKMLLNSGYVGHVIGAFYLIRKEIFDNLAGFDERFFVYYEDMDLSKRVNDMGYKIYFNAKAKIKHIGGASSSKVKSHRMFYSYQSRYIYLEKHYGKARAKVFSFLVYTIFLPLRLVKSTLMTRFSEMKDLYKVYKMYKNRYY